MEQAGLSRADARSSRPEALLVPGSVGEVSQRVRRYRSVATHQHAWLELQDPVDRDDPRRHVGIGIGIGNERNPTTEHQVPGKQQTVLFRQHHQVFGRVRRPGVQQPERQPTEAEPRDLASAYTVTGSNSTTVGLDTGCAAIPQLLSAAPQAAPAARCCQSTVTPHCQGWRRRPPGGAGSACVA